MLYRVWVSVAAAASKYVAQQTIFHNALRRHAGRHISTRWQIAGSGTYPSARYPIRHISPSIGSVGDAYDCENETCRLAA